MYGKSATMFNYINPWHAFVRANTISNMVIQNEEDWSENVEVLALRRTPRQTKKIQSDDFVDDCENSSSPPQVCGYTSCLSNIS